MTELEALQLLVKKRELGITDLEVQALMSSGTLPNVPKGVPDLEATAIVVPSFDDPTDEEVQYWATPYYDELQEKKRLHQEKLKEEKL